MKRTPIYDEDLGRDHDDPGDDENLPASRRRHQWWTFVAGAAVGLLLAAVPTVAQSPGPSPEEVARQNAVIVATLVRTSLVALHQANVTGNYSVLRDLAAPGFRDRLTAADLAGIFASLRSANIDLGAVVVLEPVLAEAPAVDDIGMLRIMGTFETRPLPVRFELMFDHADGAWRLFGIAVNPVRPTADAAPAAAVDEAAQVANAPALLVPPMPKPRPPTGQ